MPSTDEWIVKIGINIYIHQLYWYTVDINIDINIIYIYECHSTLKKIDRFRKYTIKQGHTISE